MSKASNNVEDNKLLIVMVDDIINLSTKISQKFIKVVDDVLNFLHNPFTPIDLYGMLQIKAWTLPF